MPFHTFSSRRRVFSGFIIEKRIMCMTTGGVSLVIYRKNLGPNTEMPNTIGTIVLSTTGRQSQRPSDVIVYPEAIMATYRDLMPTSIFRKRYCCYLFFFSGNLKKNGAYVMFAFNFSTSTYKTQRSTIFHFH